MFDSLQPHGPQHARPPCPSRTPRVYTNSSPLSWWCHPTISFSVVPFSSCLQWVSSSWPKYWSFSFSISPSNEYSGLISFRMDWLDLLAVQGTLKSLLQHHSYLLGNQWTWQAQSRLVVIEMGREGSLCDVMGCNSLHGPSCGRAQALFGDITAWAWVSEKVGIIERKRKCGKGSWLWETSEQGAVLVLLIMR